MKNNHLMSNDNGVNGIFRCKLIQGKNKSDIRAYIPGIHNIQVYSFNGDLNLDKYKDTLPKVQWCCYNVECKDISYQDDLCWCMFENGDFKKPVVISYALIGDGLEVGSSGSGGETSSNSSDSSSSSSNSSSNSNTSNDISSDSSSSNTNSDADGTWELLGNDFKITHYCACEKCCGKQPSDPGYGVTASGAIVKEGRTIAVDKSLIPLGSKVKIDGQVYIAEDTGGAIKGHRIDIYVSDHQRALNLGVKENVSVYLLK